MILVDKIEPLILESQCNHMRIYDRMGTNRIMDLDADDAPSLYKLFMTHADALSTYEMLTVKLGDEKTVKANWSGASVWKIKLNSIADTNSNLPVNSGYSKEYVNTSLELAKLKLEFEYSEKRRVLESEFKKDDFDKYFKYFPLFSKILGISDEDLIKKLQMVNLMNGLGAPATSTPTSIQKNKLTVEHDLTDNQKKVENIVGDLYDKVDKNKFIAVLQSLNNDPTLLDIAYQFLAQKSTGISGHSNDNNFDVNAHIQFY